MAQILEEYGTAELEIAHELQRNEADRLATGRHIIETVELPDSPPKDEGATPLEAPKTATPAPTIRQSTTEENRDPVATPALRDSEQGNPDPTPIASRTEMEELTQTEPNTVPMAEPTLEPTHSELLQTTETTGAVETETAASGNPSGSTPPIEPTPPLPSILDILDDA